MNGSDMSSPFYDFDTDRLTQVDTDEDPNTVEGFAYYPKLCRGRLQERPTRSGRFFTLIKRPMAAHVIPMAMGPRIFMRTGR